jgi:AraC-like DNA-binding protein
MTDMYEERAPAADLAGHLRCSWTHVTNGGGAVLPDGCLDLMWIGGQLVVAGPDTAATRGELGPGIEIAAVRFRPGAAPAVLGLPASELRDQRVPLAELWSDAGELTARVDDAPDRVAALEAAVRRRLADAPPVDPVALAVASRVSGPPLLPAAPVDRPRSRAASRLAQSPDGPVAGWRRGSAVATGEAGADGPGAGPIVHSAVATGRAGRAGGPGAGRGGGTAVAMRNLARPAYGPGAGRGSAVATRLRPGAAVDRGGVAVGLVAELAWRAGLSERQLHRRCVAAFGYGPKTLDRVLRLQRFLALGRADPTAGLARLAADAGYADQAHLGHDCRALAGATPAELIA